LKQAGRKEICDGNGKYIVNGVPFPAARLAGDNTKNNALSCGCWVDDALLGFLFFKNMVATSRNWKIPQKNEMLGRDPLGLRHHVFLAKAFEVIGLMVDDLYASTDFGSLMYMLDLVMCLLLKVRGRLPADATIAKALALAGQRLEAKLAEEEAMVS
jgi:hypothetical protein